MLSAVWTNAFLRITTTVLKQKISKCITFFPTGIPINKEKKGNKITCHWPVSKTQGYQIQTLKKAGTKLFFMMPCKRSVTTVHCGHKRYMKLLILWLNLLATDEMNQNGIWLQANNSLIKHSLQLWKKTTPDRGILVTRDGMVGRGFNKHPQPTKRGGYFAYRST